MADLPQVIKRKLKYIFRNQIKAISLTNTHVDIDIENAAQVIEDIVTNSKGDMSNAIEKAVPGVFSDDEKHWIIALLFRYHYKNELPLVKENWIDL